MWCCKILTELRCNFRENMSKKGANVRGSLRNICWFSPSLYYFRENIHENKKS